MRQSGLTLVRSAERVSSEIDTLASMLARFGVGSLRVFPKDTGATRNANAEGRYSEMDRSELAAQLI